MSRLNGDKSRHQINRKRTVKQRAKIRAMVAARKDSAAATEGQAATHAKTRTR
jgi:hypothetical protein